MGDGGQWIVAMAEDEMGIDLGEMGKWAMCRWGYITWRVTFWDITNLIWHLVSENVGDSPVCKS